MFSGKVNKTKEKPLLQFKIDLRTFIILFINSASSEQRHFIRTAIGNMIGGKKMQC